MGKIIGIDLGTTNSLRCCDGRRRAEGDSRMKRAGRTTPSVVAFTKSGERLVGAGENHQAAGDHESGEHGFTSIKRFMGRRFDEVNDEMKMVPYKVVKAKGDHIAVIVAQE